MHAHCVFFRCEENKWIDFGWRGSLVSLLQFACKPDSANCQLYAFVVSFSFECNFNFNFWYLMVCAGAECKNQRSEACSPRFSRPNYKYATWLMCPKVVCANMRRTNAWKREGKMQAIGLSRLTMSAENISFLVLTLLPATCRPVCLFACCCLRMTSCDFKNAKSIEDDFCLVWNFFSFLLLFVEKVCSRASECVFLCI